MGLCKSYSWKKGRKEKKREMRKNGKLSEILKTMGTQMPAWKKRRKEKREEMNRIAHVLLQGCFQIPTERYVFKEHSRIMLATIYIHHIHPYTCTFWFDCMTQLPLDLRFDFTILYCKYSLSSYLHSYELHISLSYRKRKA